MNALRLSHSLILASGAHVKVMRLDADEFIHRFLLQLPAEPGAGPRRPLQP